MNTNSKAVQIMGRDGKLNTGAGSRRHANYTKVKRLFGRMKDLVGKILIVDEDWIFKSNEWPYMWKKK